MTAEIPPRPPAPSGLPLPLPFFSPHFLLFLFRLAFSDRESGQAVGETGDERVAGARWRVIRGRRAAAGSVCDPGAQGGGEVDG